MNEHLLNTEYIIFLYGYEKTTLFGGWYEMTKKVGTKRPLNEGMKGRGYEMTVTPSVCQV